MKNLSLARQLRQQKIAEASGNVVAAYFGPEVEAGYSYGTYKCSACSFEQTSNKGEMIHCVNCGAETDFTEKISLKEVKKAANETVEFICTTCGSKTVSSSKEAKKEKSMFCPQCGSSMETADEKEDYMEDEDDVDVDVDTEEENTEEENTEDEEDIEVEEIDKEEVIDKDVGDDVGDDMDEDDMAEDIDIDIEELEDDEEEIDEEDTEDEGEGEEEDIEVVEEDTEDTSEENTEEDIEVIEDDEVDTEEEDDEAEADAVEDTEEDTEENTEENTEEDTEEKPEEEKISIEYVTDLEEASYSEDDIQMAFFDGEDPSWTVLVKGSPVAVIKLSDQPRPDEISDLFTKDDYAHNVAQAMIQCGAKEVLNQVKARYFVNKVDESAIAARMADKVRAEMEAEYQGKSASMREEFKSCIAVVLAGMNKNFFKDVDNPLKGSLYNKMKEIGVANPDQIIETAFADAADPYFDIVLTKAIDFMSKSPEAREEIAKAIGGSNTTAMTSIEDIPEGRQILQRLEKNNVIVNVTGNTELAKKSKNTIKEKLQLGKFNF